MQRNTNPGNAVPWILGGIVIVGAVGGIAWWVTSSRRTADATGAIAVPETDDELDDLDELAMACSVDENIADPKNEREAKAWAAKVRGCLLPKLYPGTTFPPAPGAHPSVARAFQVITEELEGLGELLYEEEPDRPAISPGAPKVSELPDLAEIIDLPDDMPEEDEVELEYPSELQVGDLSQARLREGEGELVLLDPVVSPEEGFDVAITFEGVSEDAPPLGTLGFERTPEGLRILVGEIGQYDAGQYAGHSYMLVYELEDADPVEFGPFTVPALVPTLKRPDLPKIAFTPPDEDQQGPGMGG